MCDKRNIIEFGPRPFVVDIDRATKENTAFRRALWTGKYLQLTLMSIPVGGEVGLEIHPDTDQFFRCEAGEGIVLMGYRKDCLQFRRSFNENDAIIIPAGTWHNLVNTGNCPLKLYSIYAPPHHPHGTVHLTKADSDAAHD